MLIAELFILLHLLGELDSVTSTDRACDGACSDAEQKSARNQVSKPLATGEQFSQTVGDAVDHEQRRGDEPGDADTHGDRDQRDLRRLSPNREPGAVLMDLEERLAVVARFESALIDVRRRVSEAALGIA